ncbi:MAG: UDP-3-O-(3-hydroxymyristoyl)glucosamine N-acyltransferase [Bacteroidia bacterium]|nr:UDP-3-O-(3-hydroxymyristoyl)glucosamine N-acyltransferase [Bacteroidia bacterium]
MKLPQPVTLAEAAAILNCQFIGPADHLITGINEIHCVEPGDLTFSDVEKYFAKALKSAATTVLLNKRVDPPTGKGILLSDQPFHDYNRLTEHFQPRSPLSRKGEPRCGTGVKIGQGVVFGENVHLEDGVEIGHNAVIGSNVTIGKHSLIHANVTIYDNCEIGAHCTLNAGAVIGGEAFYYKQTQEAKFKMLTKGRVIIHDHVDIGANSTIDRGVSGDTIIGEYTKIDNLVQVGHDTVIGKRCILASQVGIAGVSHIGDDVVLWGQVGVVSDVKIGDKAVLYGKTGVMSSLEGGKKYGGIVADDAKAFLRKEGALKRLIEIMPELEQLLKK